MGNLSANQVAAAQVGTANDNITDWKRRTKDINVARSITALADAPIWDSDKKIKKDFTKNIEQKDLPIFAKLSDFKEGMTLDDIVEKYRSETKYLYTNTKISDKNGNTLPAIKNLKDPLSMTKDEIDKELSEYSVSVPEDMKKIQLTCSRKKRNKEDAGSKALDFDTGTYSQGQQGTCTILSALNTLSEDEIKSFMSVEKDSNGKEKGYKITFPGDSEQKSVSVSLEELENDKISVNGTNYEGFSKGDYTVAAVEMAFFKRYGKDAPVVKEEKNNNGDVTGYKLTFNDNNPFLIKNENSDKNSSAGQSVPFAGNDNKSQILEQAFIKQFGKNEKYKSAIYKDENNNGHIVGMTLDDGANLFKKNGKKLGEYVDIDENYLLNNTVNGSTIGVNESAVNSDIVLPNGAVIVKGHAYSFERYDQNKKVAYIKDPYNSSSEIEVPLDYVTKYMSVSGT